MRRFVAFALAAFMAACSGGGASPTAPTQNPPSSNGGSPNPEAPATTGPPLSLTPTDYEGGTVTASVAPATLSGHAGYRVDVGVPEATRPRWAARLVGPNGASMEVGFSGVYFPNFRPNGIVVVRWDGTEYPFVAGS